jgi:hypothetical protein
MKKSKNLSGITVLSIAAAAMLGAATAQALTINATFDSNWTSSAPTAATSAINTVDSWLGSMFTNQGTVNITFGWNEVNGTAISGTTAGATMAQFYGQSGTSIPLYSLSTISGLLSSYATANPQNTVMASVVSHLPSSVSNPNGYNLFALPAAQYTALTGNSLTGQDAYIGFGGSINWQYSDTGGTVVSNAYDFMSAATHEITHALGRVDYSTSTGSAYLTPMDLVNYNCGSTTLNSTQASPACFSIDGGVTDLATLSPTSDSADWASTAATGVPNTYGSAFNAYMTPGSVGGLLTVDTQMMQALGYNMATISNVPEPASILLLFPLAFVGLFSRKKQG